MEKVKQRPQLWVVAGPNGSGKSTLVEKYSKFLPEIEFINPDNIARILEPNNFTYPSLTTQLKAGKMAIKIQNDFLNNQESFAFETTFSGKREIDLMKLAKDEGFKVNLVFVGLESPIKNIRRVEERVQGGGHFVDPEDIMRRYDRSMENIKNNFKLADRLYVFDNSLKTHKLQLSLNNNKVKYLAQDTKKWVNNVFKDTIIKHKTKEKDIER